MVRSTSIDRPRPAEDPLRTFLTSSRPTSARGRSSQPPLDQPPLDQGQPTSTEVELPLARLLSTNLHSTRPTSTDLDEGRERRGRPRLEVEKGVEATSAPLDQPQLLSTKVDSSRPNSTNIDPTRGEPEGSRERTRLCQRQPEVERSDGQVRPTSSRPRPTSSRPRPTSTGGRER